ncbi:MAG: tyrosine-type recombinase/integrase [bacterium]|nr:tyrosine-type recombinase/integrase [bacterium]MDY5456154.1 tyrosine-type recombinase/integrase [Bariatricus sp.]
MVSIVERRGRFCVVYSYKDKNGKRRQKWETYKTMSEAKKRKKEIEYRADIGQMIVPHCKTVKELLEEYVNLYGKEAWALSTYSSNVSMINNYIIPIIGGDKLENINTRFIEKYYQRLLRTPAVINPATGKRQSEFVTPATIRDIHKLLRNCLQKAVKWELMAKNPVIYATVPKYKSAKREIWTAETLMHALEVCEDDRLKLALKLAFSCSLRMGEMLELTWDCVDISKEAIAENRAYIYVDKEVQRVDKAAIQELRGKDVILVFPEESKKNKTVRVLKLPKTESSIRKVFLPKSVAEMLVEWKKGQDKIKETLGDEYMDYNLVMATPFGLPIGTSSIRKALNDLIKEHDLPPVVFHSLRHTSVTYKLKLNGGDIKAVQGDSGHSQINMVTDVYSHIIDDDRRKNAELFEQAFYEKKNLDPSMHANVAGKTVELPTNVDAELLAKVLSNPEMAALLSTLAKSLESK